MLKNVHLKNLALIREADIDLGEGLNILTGETGAGKSIIIGSINIALGEKANKSFIRNGADFGLVELHFVDNDSRIKDLLSSFDISCEADDIIVSRKITESSSISKINGENVNLTQLRAATSLLVDIHGQHDNQTLLNPAKHLELIDSFGGIEISSLKAIFKKKYNDYKAIRHEFTNYNMDASQLEKEIAFIKFELDEIEKAELKQGEDEALENEFKKLSNAEKINDGIRKVYSIITEASTSITNQLSDASKELDYLSKIEPEIKTMLSSVLDMDSIAKDLGHELSHFISNNAFDAERFRFVQNRLNEINRLKSKYGPSLDNIFSYQNGLSDKLKNFSNYSKHRAELISQMDAYRSEINNYSNLLSNKRKETATKLIPLIKGNLSDLNFLNVDFQIQFTKTDKIYENGYDKAEFLLSTNIGEPARPLVKVASGGELSRVMLAIKSAFADADSIDTLIFDEIDTGISGRTAQMVAEKLKYLSLKRQIICITHLPQIAAMADTHFVIEKAVEGGSTISGIRKLEEYESIEELSRLLSGSEITDSVLANASEMKRNALKIKK